MTAGSTRRRRPVQRATPCPQADHDHQVDGPSVRRIEPAEGRHPRSEKAWLRRPGHLGHHAGQGAHMVRRRQAPLPEATSRPRLQDRHADEVDPGGRQDDAAGAGGGPPTVGQRHEHPRHAVDQHGAWCAEEPRKAGGEIRRTTHRTPRPPVPIRRCAGPRIGTRGPGGRQGATGPTRSGSRRWRRPLCMGCSDQMLTPLLTRCCTQAGDELAVG